MFDHTGYAFQAGRQQGRFNDLSAGHVIDKVAAIGLHHLAFTLPKPGWHADVTLTQGIAYP